MKYMLMMFGSESAMREVREPDWVADMIRFMHELNDGLAASGELVAAEGLADASRAKTVRSQDGWPVVTDGPYAESKESLAGYWVLDCATEDRALEIAATIVPWSGAVEVRAIGEDPGDQPR